MKKLIKTLEKTLYFSAKISFWYKTSTLKNFAEEMFGID